MNCIEFRRGYTIEPTVKNAVMAAHRRECPSCARFARRLDSFEERLREALAVEPPDSLYDRIGQRIEREDGGTPSQVEFERHLGQALRVEIPEGLNGRILFRQAAEQARRTRRWLVPLALAASVAVAVSLVTTFSSTGDQLAEDLIAHIEREPEALESRLEISASRLGMTLEMLGMGLSGDIGQVTYAALCKVRNGLGAHLVIAGQLGPVTVMILPVERVDTARRFEQGNYRGIVVTAGRGSMAVVGSPDEPLQPVVHRLSRALRRLS